MGVKQLLAVSWALPPILQPRALQVALTLKHLNGLGWRATAVCADPTSVARWVPLDPGLQTAYDGAYDVRRVTSWEASAAARVLFRLFPPLARRPDVSRPWLEGAVRAGNALLAGGGFSAMASFAQPWTCHLAGLRLKRSSGIPWVAHFSDPWADSPYLTGGARERRWHRRAEEEVIRAADRVVFVTPQTEEATMRRYPTSWRAKARVVPHGYDRNSSPSPSSTARRGGRLRVVYSGSFYGPRTPLAFLQALAQPEVRGQAEAVFVGAVPARSREDVRRLGIEDAVVFAGPQPFMETMKLLGEADVLLVIDAPGTGGGLFLPSKLVDYLMFDKPILGMTPADGASADLLRRLGCPVTPPDDPAAAARALAELIRLHRDGTLGVSQAFRTAAAAYDARVTAQAFARILEDL